MSPPHELYESLLRTPDYFPWQWNVLQRQLVFARIDANTYRQASFLDLRLGSGALQTVLASSDAVSDACRPYFSSSPGIGFIFHIGHCGSTLVSRLLSQHAGILPVREPQVLRTLAEQQRELDRPEAFLDRTQWAAMFKTLIFLLGRGYAKNQRAIIKTSSNCNNLILPALALHPWHRAVLLYEPLTTYLAHILRPQIRNAIYSVARERILDLHAISPEFTPRLYTLTPGRLAAVNWLASMAQFTLSQQLSPEKDRLYLMNFQNVLANPESMLRRLYGFFGLDSTDAEIRNALDSGVLSQYSKDTRIHFTADMRSEELETSRRAFKDEITDALEWTRGWLECVPALASLAEQF